ncbi:MAG TPA: histidine kinase [Steroidobacteraceae bacterium]|nr:histidine kinase [Steroidobacteraceae bacterium]
MLERVNPDAGLGAAAPVPAGAVTAARAANAAHTPPLPGNPADALAAVPAGLAGPTTPAGLAGQAAGSEAAQDSTPLTGTELLLIFGFWTLIAVLSTANSLALPRTGPWHPIIPYAYEVVGIANAYMWCALTPLMFVLTRHFGIERSSWRTWIMFALLGLVVGIAVDLATTWVRARLFYPAAAASIIDFAGGWARTRLWYPASPVSAEMAGIAQVRRLWFMNEFIVYVAVLAAGFARNFFFRYRARLHDTARLQAQAAQLSAQLADARLAALRTQLNPHFLFNTLHAVSALVERDPRGVRRMIARLSDLLRTSLDEADEPEVPLTRELAFIERYLDVIQIRFQGHLQVQIHADADVRDALVPNLILQPLVENAVKHGISKLAGEGRIEVEAHRSGERVVLTVRDNGPGTGPVPAPQGVGLRNTCARLSAMYGPVQSLMLLPAAGGGLVAEVSLPYHTSSDLRAAAVLPESVQTAEAAATVATAATAAAPGGTRAPDAAGTEPARGTAALGTKAARTVQA